MQSRLFCALPDGRQRELVVLEKHGDEPQRVMYRGKLHDGDVLRLLDNDVSEIMPDQLGGYERSTVRNDGPARARRGNIIIKHILGSGIAEVESDTPLAELAEKYGTVPLPPYLHRDATADDKKRYQTIWAKNMGSAAAPTASLNMTEELLEKLQKKGVIIKYITLHVGLGTFLPIRTDNVEDHKMHSEWYSVPEDTCEAIIKARFDGKGARVIALGTTVARTLEYLGDTGVKEGENDIFIYPGYEFKTIDGLITNFHAPKSTVLMLTAAFAGWDNLKNAYDHAVKEKYNFLSYGDSMFIC